MKEKPGSQRVIELFDHFLAELKEKPAGADACAVAAAVLTLAAVIQNSPAGSTSLLQNVLESVWGDK